MEYRLVCGDFEYSIGEVSADEILPLTKAIEQSRVLDEEGNAWSKSEIVHQLYFNAFPPYFYLSLDEFGA